MASDRRVLVCSIAALETAVFASLIVFVHSFVFYLGFAFLATLSVAVTLGVGRLPVTVKVPVPSRLDFHLLFLASGVSLFLMEVTGFRSFPADSLLFVVVFGVAPGFVVMERLGPRMNSLPEYLGMAFPVSLALVSIMSGVFSPLPGTYRGQLAALVVVLLVAISLVAERHRVSSVGRAWRLQSLSSDVFILGLTLVFYSYIVLNLYPGLAHIAGFDISRNYLSALAFTQIRIGNFFSATWYPLYGAYQSQIIYSVGTSVVYFQYSAIVLNVLIALSFYALVKRYFGGNNSIVPGLSTFLWLLSGGVGWIEFVSQGLSKAASSPLTQISIADALSYGDITFQRTIFNLSMETSLALVFCLVYFMSIRNRSRLSFFVMVTLVLTALGLMHILAVLCLLAVVTLYSVLAHSADNIRILPYSLLASAALLFPVNAAVAPLSGAFVLPVSLAYTLTAALVSAVVVMKGRLDPVLVRLFSIARRNGLATVVWSLGLLFVSLYVLVRWSGGGFGFNFSSVDRFGYVPLPYYAVDLGVPLLLALVSLPLIPRCRQYARALAGLVLLVVVAVIISRSISAAQLGLLSHFQLGLSSYSRTLYSFLMEFRERRILILLKIPLVILASVSVGYTVRHVSSNRSGRRKYRMAAMVLVPLVILSGVSSTYLGFEYYYSASQSGQNYQSPVLSALQPILLKSGKGLITSPNVAAPALQWSGATPITSIVWQSESPEVFSTITRLSSSTPTYIYLNAASEADINSSSYASSVIAMLPTILSQSRDSVDELNNWSAPVPTSNSALVLPVNHTYSGSAYYGYEILSSLESNYTTILSTDSRLAQYATIVFPSDDPNTLHALDAILNCDCVNNRNIMILNPNGYGPVSGVFAKAESGHVESTAISGPEHVSIPQTNVTLMKVLREVDTVSQFVGANESSPFIMVRVEGGDTLAYVNVYPLASDNSSLYIIDRSISGALPGWLAQSSNNEAVWFGSTSMYFSSFRALGRVEIDAQSVVQILPENGAQTVSLKVRSALNDASSVVIKSREVSEGGGVGFYTWFVANNASVSWTLNPANPSEGGLPETNRNMTMDGSIAFLARNPTFDVNGTVDFSALQIVHGSHLYTDGQEVAITGLVKLEVYAASTYSLVTSYTFQSPVTVSYIPPLLTLNEISWILRNLF